MKRALFVVVILISICVLATANGNIESKVVVYSPHGDEMLERIAEGFQAETEITMEFLYAGGGELVDRIRAEKGNPQADVLYGNPSSVFIELKEEGLLDSASPSWDSKLPSYYKDADGAWYGTIQTPVVLFYNHDMLDEDQAPTDWFDLTDPEYTDQIIFRSTTSAASRATHAALMYQFDHNGTLESEGWDWFARMDANVKRYVYNSSLMFQAIARQEGSIGFWTLSGVIDNVTNNNMPFTIINAKSGSPVITDSVGIIKNGPNRSAAEKFVEYVGSAEVQLMLAEERNLMPTHPDALKEAPEWMQSFTYKPMDIDWGRMSEKQSEWIMYFEDNVRDSSKVETQ